MSRTAQQRLDATLAAIERRNEFLKRVEQAADDSVRLSDLMAEAIQMLYESNGLETVGQDGRVWASIENMVAAHCMLGARTAYLKSRGSNQQ